jgi:hypothetical protein
MLRGLYWYLTDPVFAITGVLRMFIHFAI